MVFVEDSKLKKTNYSDFYCMKIELAVDIPETQQFITKKIGFHVFFQSSLNSVVAPSSNEIVGTTLAQSTHLKSFIYYIQNP